MTGAGGILGSLALYWIPVPTSPQALGLSLIFPARLITYVKNFLFSTSFCSLFFSGAPLPAQPIRYAYEALNSQEMLLFFPLSTGAPGKSQDVA